MIKERRIKAFRQWAFYLIGRVPDWTMRAINRLIALQVDDRAFQKVDKFDWIPQVEALYPKIREEVDQLVEHIEQLPTIQEIIPANDYYFSDVDWRQAPLYSYGTPIEDHCAMYPNVWKAMQQIPGLVTGSISTLGPGERIPAHSHAYKGLLIYHLGVIIPRSGNGCGIRMQGETRNWVEGKVSIIDPTFDHEVWNHSDDYRVILLGEFRRPDLPRYLRFLDILFLSATRQFIGKHLVKVARHLAADQRRQMELREATLAESELAKAAS